MRTGRGTWVVFAALVALVVVYGLIASTTSLWDRDEPRFARAAVEMVRSGNYLTPTFNDKLRPDKPAMVYWLMSVPVRWLGATEIAVRLPSIVGLALSSLLTFFIGRRMFDAATGLRAMLILASTSLAVVEGTAATADGTLLGFIMLAFYGFVEMVYTSRRWWPGTLMAIALGGALLTKGPVGLAVPLLTMICALSLGRRHVRVGWSGITAIVLASAVGIGLFFLWALPANTASGGALASEGLGRHVWQRMFGPLDGHGGAGLGGYLTLLPIYVPMLIVGFLPWTMVLPLGFWALWRGYIGQRRERIILWSWLLPTFILMSLVATKLPHYIFPIFPALSLMAAAAIGACTHGRLPEMRRNWLAMGAWFYIPFVLVTCAGSAVGPYLLGMPELYAPVISMTLVFAAGSAAVLLYHLTDRVAKSAVILMLIPAFMLLPTMYLVMPHVEKHLKPSPALAQVVRQYSNGQIPVYMAGYEEASLVFYIDGPTGYHVEAAGSNITTVKEWIDQDGPMMLIIKEQLRDEYEVKYGKLGLDVLFEKSVINYASYGRSHNLLLLGREVSGDLAIDDLVK